MRCVVRCRLGLSELQELAFCRTFAVNVSENHPDFRLEPVEAGKYTSCALLCLAGVVLIIGVFLYVWSEPFFCFALQVVSGVLDLVGVGRK